jgi:cytochrome P450
MLVDVDLNDSRLFDGGPPHDLFARLRAEPGLHWSPPGPDVPGFHCVTRYEDIVRVNKDWSSFSSAGEGITLRPGAILPAEFAQFAFIFMDPPQHNRHRAIVQKVFTAAAVAARADDIRRIAGELIDEVIERGECDLVADLGARFPLIVTSNMLGVPRADQAKLFAWTNDMTDTELPPDKMMATMGEMFAYISALASERRVHPRDDLLSRLIAAEVDGQQPTEMEVVLHFVQITAGGNETTRDAFAGGMEALMQFPDQRRRLLEDPGLIPGAVEEILRWHTPIHCFARTATTDAEVSGTLIEAGDRVALWYCSGNRDPAANPDPDRFDVTRGRVNHVSFGGGGIHFCIGNQLSRLELAVVLREVLRRLPDTELAGPVVRMPSTVFHAMREVPVSFTPGGREAATS